jgi:hypothetical protein
MKIGSEKRILESTVEVPIQSDSGAFFILCTYAPLFLFFCNFFFRVSQILHQSVDILFFTCSVAVPDPLIRLRIRILLSSRKIGRKTLISTVFWLLNDFISLKNDVNVP